MLYQTELVNLDDLVIREHSYRGFKEVFDYRDVIPKLRKIEKEEYYKGYGAESVRGQVLHCHIRFSSSSFFTFNQHITNIHLLSFYLRKSPNTTHNSVKHH